MYQNRTLSLTQAVDLEQPVVILFSPAGNVDGLYCWQGLNTSNPMYGTATVVPASGLSSAAPPYGIHLLLGMQSQLQVPVAGPAGGGTYPLPVTSDQPNWLSTNSL